MLTYEKITLACIDTSKQGDDDPDLARSE
jgi:hypothetical protein